MLTLHMENFRLFSTRQNVHIRPLTILVGENSSGKSSLLAALAAILDPTRFPWAPDFNRPPFNLGSYDSIATYKGGRFGRAPHFLIGYTLDEQPEPPNPRTALAHYGNRRGQPELRRFLAKAGDITVELIMEPSSPSSSKGTARIRSGQRSFEFPYAWPSIAQDIPPFSLFYALFTDRPHISEQEDAERRRILHTLLSTLYAETPASPIAPIRSKPERVYERSKQTYEPTGEHIPYLIDSLLGDEATSSEAETLRDALRDYGASSGLFKGIHARRLGDKPGSPFQLMVSLRGPARNLVDVGYGVSQALPLIVQAAVAQQQSVLLFQQPEIHLHPRAQAALGTFFAVLATHRHSPIVVETHSDFVIDRVRLAVAKGIIPADSVALVFCERVGFEGHLHQLTIDPQGNILNAPSAYREFFMQEQLDLFRRASDS